MSRGAILTEPEAVQSYGFFDPERLLGEINLRDDPVKDGCRGQEIIHEDVPVLPLACVEPPVGLQERVERY